jgi:O-Antigen ligase
MRDRRGRYPFGGGEARLALVAWAVVLGIGLGVFVAQNGRPDTWVANRWEEFRDVEPKPVIGVSAFGTGASNRFDYWRVAWRTFKAEPVEGVGSGAFSVPWFRWRSVNENVADAHSWQAGASAETGIVGLALMAAVLLLPLAAIRNARQARGAWPIATVALGGTSVYFVLHASVDWLLRVPGVAIPAFVALGALATGGKAVPLELASLRERLGLVAAALVVAALVVPAYISTADMSRAQDDAETSNERALDKLDWAARVNPFAVEPLVVRAALLGSRGDYAGAAEAAEDATERGPDNWTAWLALAEAERLRGDNAAAEAAFERAAALNPRAPKLAR